MALYQIGVDDWQQYTERLEQFFVANGITEDGKKLAMFLTVVGANTYLLLSNLLALKKPATKSYDELVAVVKEHLDRKPLVIVEHYRFHQRKQGKGETVAQYMAELRNADKCEFGMHLQDALRDRLVCWLCQEDIQLKLLILVDLTMKKAYETAHGTKVAQKCAC